MAVNLIRTNPNNNHHVDRIQTNISNSISQALEVRRHANFPVRVVHAIKPRSFAKPLHVAFADQEPVKVEWSLICSDTNWRTENDDQWGEWEPKHFFQNLSQANPKSSKLPNVVPTSQLVTRCSWWWPTNTADTQQKTTRKTEMLWNTKVVFSTSMELKQEPNSKYSKPIGDFRT